jgi:hypothetical protein
MKSSILIVFFAGIILKSQAGTVLLKPSDNIRSAIQSSKSGDTLLLSDGDYQSPGWLDNIKFTNTVVIKAQNNQKARFVSGNGININNCSGLQFEGLEITSLATNSGLIQIQGQSSYIFVKNCHVHHAPVEADCIKVNQSNNIDIIGCHLHDPGTRAAGNGQQETLDYLDVDTGVIRSCLFTGGTSRQYVNAKGLSSNIIIENCIMKDHNGDQGDAAIVLGGWSSDNIFTNTPNGYECENIVVRNNIILNSKTGIFQISNVKNGYIYNNYAWNCTGYNNYRGLIYVSPGNGPGSNKGTVHLEIFNNIFASDGSVPLPISLMQLSGTTLDSFSYGNNLYYLGGRIIPSAGVFNPNNETNAVFTNPGFSVAQGTSYDDILKSLAPTVAGSWVNTGSNDALNTPFPGVIEDIFGVKATAGEVDIGPFNFRVLGIDRKRIDKNGTVLSDNRQVSGSKLINVLLNGAVGGNESKIRSAVYVNGMSNRIQTFYSITK